MKLRRRCVFLLYIVLFGLFIGMIEINAVNTGFQVNSKPINEKNTFISNANISLINEEPAKESIACFDVNDLGLVAIGQNKLEEKTICVYSNDGSFQYGYTFNCTGSFGVEWDEKNLNIYFVRSDVIVSITPDGEILNVFEVQDTSENVSYNNHLLYSTEKTIGNYEYIIRNDMGVFNLIATSYSQVVVKDMVGTERVIYDVNAMQFSKMIATLVIILVVISVLLVVIGRICMRLMREHREQKHG